MCNPTLRVFLAVFLTLAVAAAACSDDEPGDGPDATTQPAGLVFGEGELPDSVPDGFPVPQQAVIGRTLVDPANDRTEVIVRVSASTASVAQFYDINLVNQGYVIDSSSGDSQGWEIDFRRDGLAGSVTIVRVEDDISQYSIELVGS